MLKDMIIVRALPSKRFMDELGLIACGPEVSLGRGYEVHRSAGKDDSTIKAIVHEGLPGPSARLHSVTKVEAASIV
jgi:hypothetical protein